eukprot:scaffold34632_cov168-Amphora_coffeaeformis.AAC.5
MHNAQPTNRHICGWFLHATAVGSKKSQTRMQTTPEMQMLCTSYRGLNAQGTTNKQTQQQPVDRLRC